MDKLKPLLDYGHRHFGENYVQELNKKSSELPKDIQWHFIGHLQTKKCKEILKIPNIALIETVDSEKIANELNKLEILLDAGTTINEIHIEENIGISKDYNVFELVNAVSVRDVTKANRIVGYFDNNPKATSILFVIISLFNHFSRLMKIHFLDNKSKESIAASMRVPPFVAGQLMGSAKIYNPKKIAANITILHEYDLKSKGINNSSFTDGELMKELIYQIMN